MHKVLVLVGSLRSGSINRKLAGALEKLSADRLEFTYANLGDLPLYNDELWNDPPAAVTKLKADIEAADGVLFVTPEYNRTYSSIIANALHWGSRPYGKNSWSNKPAAITGASPGAIGTAAAQALLRSVVLHLDPVVMGQPELYLQMKEGLIADDHTITNEDTRKFVGDWINKFADWIDRHS
tara:strand:- start:377 stop:922 length:546 start_codon:yes stop_codon:yes gene_type:complete